MATRSTLQTTDSPPSGSCGYSTRRARVQNQSNAGPRFARLVREPTEGQVRTRTLQFFPSWLRVRKSRPCRPAHQACRATPVGFRSRRVRIGRLQAGEPALAVLTAIENREEQWPRRRPVMRTKKLHLDVRRLAGLLSIALVLGGATAVPVPAPDCVGHDCWHGDRQHGRGGAPQSRLLPRIPPPACRVQPIPMRKENYSLPQLPPGD